MKQDQQQNFTTTMATTTTRATTTTIDGAGQWKVMLLPWTLITLN
jgi:hypothetical protein